MPPVGDALQLVLVGVFELQPRARGEVFDRGAHQNFPRGRECADPGADVDREAADVVTGEFDLPGVAPSADAQASKGGRSLGDSRSDRPTPRRSMIATRAKEPSPVSILLYSGTSQFQCRLEMKPGTHNRLVDPSPKT